MDFFKKKRGSTSKDSDEKKKKEDSEPENVLGDILSQQSKTFGKHQAFKLSLAFIERAFINPRVIANLKDSYYDNKALSKILLDKVAFLKPYGEINERCFPLFIFEDPAMLECPDVLNVNFKNHNGQFVSVKKLKFVEVSILYTEEKKIKIEDLKRNDGYLAFKTSTKDNKEIANIGSKISEEEVRSLMRSIKNRPQRSKTPPKQVTPPPSPTESESSLRFSDTEDTEFEDIQKRNVEHVTDRRDSYKSVDISILVKDKSVEELHDIIKKLKFSQNHYKESCHALKGINDRRRQEMYNEQRTTEVQVHEIIALKKKLNAMNDLKAKNLDLEKQIVTLKKNEKRLIEGKQKLQEENKNLEKKSQEVKDWCHLECFEKQEKLKRHVNKLADELKDCEKSNANLISEKSDLEKTLVEEFSSQNLSEEGEYKRFLCSLLMKNKELERQLSKKDTPQCDKTKCGQVLVNKGVIHLLLEEIERMKQICKICDKCKKAYEDKPIKDWDPNLNIPGSENRKFMLKVLAKYKSSMTSKKVRKSEISEKEKAELISTIVSKHIHLTEELNLQKNANSILMKRHLYTDPLPISVYVTPKPKKKEETQTIDTKEEKTQKTEVFKCELCDEESDSAQGLFYHYSLAHRSEREKSWDKCSKCDKLLVGNIQQHICSKTQFVYCEFCKKAFVDTESKCEHLAIYCEVCDKAFADTESKCEHLAKDSTKVLDSTKALDSTPQKSQTIKSDNPKKKENFNKEENEKVKCPYCPKYFKNSESLRSHKNNAHKPIGDSNVVTAYADKVECEYCFTSMLQKNLKRHYEKCKVLKGQKKNG